MDAISDHFIDSPKVRIKTALNRGIWLIRMSEDGNDFRVCVCAWADFIDLIS